MAYLRATNSSSGGVSISDFTNPFNSTSTATQTYTISNKSGEKYLVLLFYFQGSAMAYNRLDGATCSGGTLTKINNMRSVNATGYGTYYNLNVTSNTCTITAPYTCFYQVFGVE